MEKNNKTIDILIVIFIALTVIATISIILLKSAESTYEKEKSQEKTIQLSNVENNKAETHNESKDEEKEEDNATIEEYDESKIKLPEEYVPIKFITTGDNEGYWVKTTQDDEEWCSIDDGIYPTYAYSPKSQEMTFLINREYQKFDVLIEWDRKLYLWIPKIESKEYNISLFLKSDKGTFIIYDNGWENNYNITYNRNQKIDVLPVGEKEKIIEAYSDLIKNTKN